MIYKKLLAFQKLNVTVKKDSSNPFFKSKYVSLNEVLDKVKPELSKLGVVIIQIPQIDGLMTRLVDTEDDTFVEAIMPYVGATDAQKLGSANTYNRRYSLVTILGLEDEEDDDGNVASSTKQNAAPSTNTTARTDKVADGDYTIKVLSQKEGETNGMPWIAINADIGRLFNNSGYDLEDGASYDVQVMKQGIYEVRPA